jgi:hypothetical protein
VAGVAVEVTTMPSEVFWTATMLAGPRRRTEPHCLQYTENIGFSEFAPRLRRLDRVAELGRQDTPPNPALPGFQGWPIRTNPVMIDFDHDY